MQQCPIYGMLYHVLRVVWGSVNLGDKKKQIEEHQANTFIDEYFSNKWEIKKYIKSVKVV